MGPFRGPARSARARGCRVDQPLAASPPNTSKAERDVPKKDRTQQHAQDERRDIVRRFE